MCGRCLLPTSSPPKPTHTPTIPYLSIIVARLIHLSSQCVRSKPTRQYNPSHPIRCLVLGQAQPGASLFQNTMIVYTGEQGG